MNKIMVSLIIAVLLSANLYSQQGISINSTGAIPDNSAILDVSSTSQGMLIPRMSTAERNAIVAPANGLFIYNTDCYTFNFYNGASWVPVTLANTLSTPGAISGDTVECQNNTGVAYSVAPVSGATTYTWYVPAGAAIASGQGSASITVDFGTVSGNIFVIASNDCQTSNSSDTYVILESAISATPVATSATNTDYTEFDANWNSVAGATSYNIDVATDTGFTSFVGSYNNLNVGNVTSYHVSGLTCNTNYYYRIRGVNSCGQSVNSNRINRITSACPVTPVNQNECGTSYTYYEVSSSSGEVWLDRNLGATQVAVSMNDYLAYGSLFQWGRPADGHECITWSSATSGTPYYGTTTTRSGTDVPGHNLLIKYSSSPYDWRNPQNVNLWQGLGGTNNPCPTGYRIPTSSELNAERLLFSSNDPVGAFNSVLKFVRPGYRDGFYDGTCYDGNSIGYYWSSTVSAFNTTYNLDIRNGNSFIGDNGRALGLSVRCIKD